MHSIKAIKNGDIEASIELLNELKDKVYTLVCLGNNSDDFNYNTIRVLVDVFRDIKRKKFIGNSNTFINKSIIKNLRKHGIKINSNQLSNLDLIKAPPQVERSVLIELSRLIQKSHRRTHSIKFIGIILVFFVICSSLYFVTVALSKPKEGETIYNSKGMVKLKDEISYYESYRQFSGKIFGLRININLISLGENGMAYSYAGYNLKGKIQVYSQGKFIKELDTPSNYNLVAGSLENNYFIFKTMTEIVKTTTDIKDKKTKPLIGDVFYKSNNNNYIVIKESKNDYFQVIDLETFEVIDKKQGYFIGVTNKGELIPYYDKIIDTIGPNNFVVDIKVLNDESIFMLLNNGQIFNIKDNNIMWRDEIDLNKLLQYDNSSDRDRDLKRGYVLESKSHYHVVFVYNEYQYIQSYTKEGNPIHDIIAERNELPEVNGRNYNKLPVVSYNSDLLLVEDYRGGRWKSFNYKVINAESVPMRQDTLITEDNSQGLIESTEKGDYIYTESHRSFYIFFVKKQK